MTPTLLRPRPEVDEDPRLRARRLEVTTDRRRRRARALGVVAVVATLLVLGWWVAHSSLLGVDTIRVEGNQALGADEVAAAAGISRGQPLIDVDTATAAARARQAPLIADATVAKAWSGTVVIRIVERQPVAVVAAADQRAVVDATGRVLAVTASPPAGLPLVDGVQAPAVGGTLDQAGRDAVAVAAGLPPGVRSRVDAVSTGQAGVVLRLRPVGTAILGRPEDRSRAITSLATVLAQVDLVGLCRIDLRVPDAPVLTRSTPCT